MSRGVVDLKSKKQWYISVTDFFSRINKENEVIQFAAILIKKYIVLFQNVSFDNLIYTFFFGKVQKFTVSIGDEA